jgi:ribonuclease HII
VDFDRLGRLQRMERLCLSQVRLRYVVEGRPLDAATEASLSADTRSGARAILAAIARRRFDNRSEGQRLRKLLRYEGALWSVGVQYVAGVDEAGMSPLAGPVAAAAVIFPPGSRLPGVDDSKKLDAALRERLAVEIKATAVAWSVAFADVEEIDSINIYWASRLAMRRAIAGLACQAQHVLVDGRRLKGLELPQQAIIKGDAKSLTIAGASILAKTARDELMCKLDAVYPGYGFARHKGYPVPEHRAALSKLGACATHRRSFAPVRTVLGLPPLPPWPAPERANGAGY